MKTFDCIIVGAGISGLSVAHELQQRGASLLVVEGQSVPGGSMRSEQTADGFILENGPNTVLSSDPALQEHFAELGLASERIVADRKGARRFVVHHGDPTLLPMSPPTFFRTPLLSTPAKLRLLAELVLPRARTSDESITMFFSRRLGPEPMRMVADPFVSGVYAGDPNELSVQATFPTLWEADQQYGSIVRGMFALARKRKKERAASGQGKRRRSEMISFRTGLMSWPQAIADRLGPERLWFNTPASTLEHSDGGWRVTVQRNGQAETLYAPQVVLALPAPGAAELVAGLDDMAAEALRAIPYPPLAIVHLGYRREDVAHPLDGFGLLCPSHEDRRILGTLWPSSIFPDRAPDGMVLTTSFVGGARRPELARQDGEELVEMVMQEQRELLGAHGEPTFVKVAHWDQAIAQYNAGHLQRIAELERLESLFYGLHLIGNYRDGVSVERCWHKGHELGQSLPLPQRV